MINGMKAEELMIGDWVSCTIEGETFNGRIDSIDGNTEDLKISLYNAPYGWEDGDAFDEISPIPLTEDIIKKHFSYQHREFSDCYLIDEDRDLYVCPTQLAVCSRNIAGDWEYYPVADIIYVHELQHALRLCGINKEITL